MAAQYILSLDQGTTSSRAIIFEHSGSIVATAQKEFKQHYPKPGWVEHDATEIWSTQIGVATEALGKAGVKGSQLAAIGITNQRETTIIWDRQTGRPIHNAIVWQDRRTSAYCDQLRSENWADAIQQKTGLIVDAYFSGTKVKWLLDNVEGARERAANGELAFGTVDSWLVWNLTGGELHITDVTNASRTMLYNIKEQQWDDELLAKMNIPKALLPEVRPSSQFYGYTTGENMGTNIPVAGMAGDQQSALFGQLCSRPGMAKNTYGTGSFVLMNTGEKPIASQNNLLTTVAWQLDGQPVNYALEGAVFIAGAVVQWIRDEMGLIRKSDDIEKLAKKVPDNGGVYLVPAFVGLGAPHWDQYARGVITGLTRGANKYHIARAALESIAYQAKDVLEAMQQDSGIELKELRVDGGATVNDTLMQFQADILQIPVLRPTVSETTALGAAYLAGLGVGFWKDLDDLQDQWKLDRQFTPQMEEATLMELDKGWKKALQRAKDWADE